ncbi:hypothetical protein TW95_gp0447 [Pandoravirus inopinatum]|uniref:Transmembrane protein n=1 Tax=Pandoravirus inopinatum TaxID=1605721 RepID=A0A0B5J8T4_9VIRU|nr:hypothetical protein TW95_gp0447 [Pandoravirus inopinatum]AJF97181.1 hypothetical protein [Pandoravirus inopinatum]
MAAAAETVARLPRFLFSFERCSNKAVNATFFRVLFSFFFSPMHLVVSMTAVSVQYVGPFAISCVFCLWWPSMASFFSTFGLSAVARCQEFGGPRVLFFSYSAQLVPLAGASTKKERGRGRTVRLALPLRIAHKRGSTGRCVAVRSLPVSMWEKGRQPCVPAALCTDTGKEWRQIAIILVVDPFFFDLVAFFLVSKTCAACNRITKKCI